MPGFCLLPKHADAFRAKVTSGELNPDDLMAMTSAERHATFAEFLGEANARPVNALFESKLLLKHQQEGIITWAQKVAGLKPEVQRDILARVQRMDRVLEPKELDAFLSDLAHQKLGFGVSMEEAGRISELAKNTADAKAAIADGGDRFDYGRARVEFTNYVSGLKNAAEPGIVSGAREVVDPTLSAGDRASAAGKVAGRLVKAAPGFAKSFKATLDNSALFRQGWKTLFTHPSTWGKNAAQSFVDITHVLKGHEVLDAANADILSRPNAINGLYQKSGLAVGVTEEAYPSAFPERIPGIGRLFKASEQTYTAFLRRMRADVFDSYVTLAQHSGVELSDPAQAESIGKLVNNLTGRGHLGSKLEPAAGVINDVFFSGRKLKSDIDFLTAHALQEGVTPFVRKQAALNLFKVVGGTAGILAIADAVSPGSVDYDPRSSNFGKIKVGNTRFDVTGGMGSLVTLAARLATHATKSSTSGKVTQLNSGDFGSKTMFDVGVDFFTNKLSPTASVVKDLMKGQDFSGNPITVQNEAVNMFAPLPFTTYQELANDPHSANILAAMIADGLGVSVNDYGPPKKHKKKGHH
jgi:hypothetical protein